MSVSVAELELVCDQLTTRLGWLDVSVGGHGSALPWSCAEVIAAQECGEDPTARWRQTLTDMNTRTYGLQPPPQVAAAVVLLWYLDVLAYPATYAAALGPWVVDVSPDAVRFDLDDSALFPCAVSLTPGAVETVADPGERLALVHQRYLDHARRFVASYEVGVKMSSRQRYGAVRDTWAIASRRAAQACLPSPAPAPALRESCCFIYLLPGASVCAMCPRRAAEIAFLGS